MAFRVRCKCGALAAIQSSNEMDLQLKQVYCQCTDPECGHSFVMNVEFSHTLSPSAHDLPEYLRKRLRDTAPAEQASLFMEAQTGS